MQSVFKGSKTCLATLLSSTRCANLENIATVQQYDMWKRQENSRHLDSTCLCHMQQQLKASKQVHETEDQIFRMEKKVKIETKEEIQRQKIKRVIVLADMDASGGILHKGCWDQEVVVFGFKDKQRKKKTKHKFSSLLCSHICECTN